ncbi:MULTISPECIES: NAD(P)H-quinone oxidoreductase subunit F [Trichocoleus]|uniref:NAD(P)H-quinone oxidoreductase subunit F n=1 Tax=Trichocoleus desertorum GB2-A4 TaxID=2933944 RepID=A0ABV0J5G5_9CYAN|nr:MULTISPECIES: NAD(P)H-quinone oxidoreductase subunit F [unclassified Trichocoleus]MBD1863853.1 NAD(P)H-quinone oxidoreductase subunit F [Trichocoleus sp. FACHB-46]MBD2095397.1 NAD(P)H-quinone oxidoreductase subunit F [Trichocoleus sp. FACHB-591]
MSQLLLESIWLIPCYALVGTVLAIPWSPGLLDRVGPRPAGYLNLLMTTLAFGHSLLALWSIGQQAPQQIFFPWLHAAGLQIDLAFLVSPVTLSAIAVVTGLNLLTQLFAIGYLEMDWGWARFFALMGFFEAGVCSLALCNSLFFSYVFLELLTLATYLLVGFWFAQPLVMTGARDAFWTKRVGDLILFMGVIALFPLAGTWNFTELGEWAATANLSPLSATLLGLALISGPLGKCAQFPFQLWLDEAMEAPIPASILRNSVVVGAGAYVLIKLQPVLALSPVALTALVVFGTATALGASLIAIAQIDIKRALSYLVSAYMGLVFIAVGTQHPEAAQLLLLTQSCSFALLFMAAGAVIWTTISQDLTQLGGLWSRRPISGLALLVGGGGLIALPPFGGFWGLLQLADSLWTTRPWLVGVLLIVNGLTTFSLMRVFGLTFGGQPTPMTERSPEVSWPMALPMTVLTVFTLLLPLVLEQFNLLPNWADLNKQLAPLIVWSSVLGGSLGGAIYLGNALPKPVKLFWQPLQEFFAHDFYIQRLYQLTIVSLVNYSARLTAWFDRHVVDGAVNAVGFVTLFSGQALRYTASGQSQLYVLLVVFSLIAIGFLVSWSF